MKSATSLSNFLHTLFPDAGEDLLHLYETAAENSNLLRVDFYTIHDLVELSGYTTQEPLHVLLLIMLLALDEGSLCVDASEAGLARRLTDLIGGPAARAWAERISKPVQDSDYAALIGTRVDEGKPVVLHRVGAKSYLYFQKYLKHELVLQRELRKRLRFRASACSASTAAEHGKLALQQFKAIIKEVVGNGQVLKLNRGQQLALGLALLRDFVLVSGGPGTGKTSIVFSLLRCLLRSGIAVERIALAAPTGRAAQRLTDAVGTGLEGLGENRGRDDELKELSARTLHQVLGYNPSRDTYRHHPENPLPYDVVIVDEVSMVGLVLMAHLFQALAPATKLILLGDKDQLPSVDAGAVLATLAPAERTPSYSAAVCAQLTKIWDHLALEASTASDPLQDALVVLEENYRSQGIIQKISRALNAQQMEVVDDIPSASVLTGNAAGVFAELEKRPGCWLLEEGQGDLAKWRLILEQWATHHYLSPRLSGDVYQDLVVQCENIDTENIQPHQKNALERLFALLAAARILTLVREGPWGCFGVNAMLEQVLRPRLDRQGSSKLFAGMPVLITRNDYNRLLFNGDVGIALRGRGGYRVMFQRAGDYSASPAEALPAHEPAFAITVHKSQGSEYEEVLLVLPPEGGRRLLTKEMVYTGITRAKRLAVICGKRDVLRHAIGRKVERESALLEW